MVKKYNYVGFGETMVRFTAPNYQRLEQSCSLNINVSGAELNVAVNISKMGLRASWVSKLVDTWSGQYILNKAREHNVDVSNVILTPFDGLGKVRNGFSFIELGIGYRSSRMIYDRGHSAISAIKPGEIEWKEILSETDWFHVTGISTAISENMKSETKHSLEMAKSLGVRASFDLNFRSTLWSQEKAQKTMKQIMPLIDVVIGNEEDFDKMLGIKAAGVTEDYQNIDLESYRILAEKVVREYPNIKIVGMSLREVKSGLLNNWQTAMLYKNVFYNSKKYKDMEILDRIGGGDSFASALIYSLITNKKPQDAIEFSAAYSALCHNFMGDWNLCTKEEAENVMSGGSARIVR